MGAGLRALEAEKEGDGVRSLTLVEMLLTHLVRFDDAQSLVRLKTFEEINLNHVVGALSLPELVRSEENRHKKIKRERIR